LVSGIGSFEFGVWTTIPGLLWRGGQKYLCLLGGWKGEEKIGVRIWQRFYFGFPIVWAFFQFLWLFFSAVNNLFFLPSQDHGIEGLWVWVWVDLLDGN